MTLLENSVQALTAKVHSQSRCLNLPLDIRMAPEFDKLRSLYIKYDTLAAAGDDVVADLRKEIKNLELSYLRDVVIPKVAKLLYRETSELRCRLDCNLQAIDSKIEYSFCTDDSPLVRASVTSCESDEEDSLKDNSECNIEIVEKLRSTFSRLSDLSNEIESCKTEAFNVISQLQFPADMTLATKECKQAIENSSDGARLEQILYCRSQMCDAKGALMSNRDIIVLKGSILRKDATPTYGSKAFRADILERYCSLTETGYVVLRDLPPMSVSGASGLCLGRSSNGYMDWKDKGGTRLADLK